MDSVIVVYYANENDEQMGLAVLPASDCRILYGSRCIKVEYRSVRSKKYKVKEKSEKGGKMVERTREECQWADYSCRPDTPPQIVPNSRVTDTVNALYNKLYEAGKLRETSF